MGGNTTASGNYSYAGGSNNIASGEGSSVDACNGCNEQRAYTKMMQDLHTTGITFEVPVDSLGLPYQVNSDSLYFTQSIVNVISHGAGNANLLSISTYDKPLGTKLEITGNDDIRTVTLTTGGNIHVGLTPLILGLGDDVGLALEIHGGVYGWWRKYNSDN